MAMKRQEDILGANVLPVVVGNTPVIALKIFDDDVCSEERVSLLSCCQAANPTLEAKI